ncbi:Cytochrome c oxidase subunit 4 [Coemansia sp. RSA 552]|nr:Cytochrome c oxidase subunit 4 [Coemansia sp. RSA 552]
MFSAARRNLLRATTPASVGRLGLARNARSFTAAAVRLSDHSDENAPILQGPDPKAGRIPTNFEQSTGDERKEYVAAMENKDYYDMGPLVIVKKGTRTDPTIVPSGAPWRLVGCQGAPGEDHELIWIRVQRANGIDRCPECGNCYKLSETGFNPDNLQDSVHEH